MHATALLAGVRAIYQLQAAEIEPLMRAAHSIKGAARIVGVGDAAELAGALEDAFVAVQQGRLRLEPADGDASHRRSPPSPRDRPDAGRR